jgi:hypothetical protein
MGRMLVAALVLGLVLAGSAQAAIDLRPVGASDATPQSDGVRYAAWSLGTSVTVLDDSGATQSFDAPQPTDCPNSDEPLYRVVAVGGGLLLLRDCSTSSYRGESPRVTVRDLGTGAALPVVPPRDPNIGSDFKPVLRSVGANWIGVQTGTNHFIGRSYWNWHDGDVELENDQGKGGNARNTPDVNAPDLYRRLCSPLRRELNDVEDPYSTSSKYAETQYLRPYLLTRLHPKRVPGDHLALERCGSRHRRLLSRCAAGCADEQLGRGHVVWREGDQMHVYVLRTRRHLHEPLPGPAERSSVRITGRRLVVETGGVVYAGRLPSR